MVQCIALAVNFQLVVQKAMCRHLSPHHATDASSISVFWFFWGNARDKAEKITGQNCFPPIFLAALLALHFTLGKVLKYHRLKTCKLLNSESNSSNHKHKYSQALKGLLQLSNSFSFCWDTDWQTTNPADIVTSWLLIAQFLHQSRA